MKKQNKTVRWTIRVSDREAEKVLLKVKRLGTTLSKYLRKRIGCK